MKNKITTVLTKVFGKTADEVEKLFTETDGNVTLSDDFDTVVLSWNEARTKALKDQATTAHDKGYSKAKKEVLTDYERLLKEAGYLKEGEQGVERLLENIEAMNAQRNSSKLKDDDVKAHPVYLQLEADVKKKYISKEEHEKKIGDLQKTITETERMTRVKTTLTEAMKYFNPEQYILSDDPARRANQIRLLQEKIAQEFDDTEGVNGETVLIKEGKRREDTHGNTIKLQELVSNLAEAYYEKKPQGAAGSAGNNNNTPAGQGGKKYTFKAGSRTELYNERTALQKDAKTAEEKSEIAKQALEYERTNKLQ